jgi:hypothetical protein
MSSFNALIFVLALSQSLTLGYANKVTFILDLLKSQTKPTNIFIGENCFNWSEKLELMRKSFVPMVFSKQDSLKFSDFKENPQNCLFTLDLTCSGEEKLDNIIQKVEIRILISIYKSCSASCTLSIIFTD